MYDFVAFRTIWIIFLIGELSFIFKRDKVTNIKNKTKKHVVEETQIWVRSILLIKSNETQWGGHKSKPNNENIYQISQ